MNDVVFDNPNGWVWMAMAAVCAVFALRSILIFRAGVRRFSGAAVAGHLLPPGILQRRVIRAVLCVVMLSLLVLAWMGPRWGAYLERVQQRPIDIVVCLDVSRSMLAEDVGMSRLDRAKDDTRRLLDRMAGGSVGLVAFAGRGVMLCPLTDDYDYLRMTLDEADTHSAQAGGTDLGRAVAAALKLFDETPDRRKAVFLLTDGEDHSESAMAYAAEAAERGIRIFAFGYGDARQGTLIPIDDDEGRSYLRYEGKQVLSRMDSEGLAAVAAAGDGTFVESTWGGDVRAIERTYDREFSTINGQPIQDSRTVRRHARYQWLVAIALLLLVIDTVLPEYRRRRSSFAWPRLRAVRLASFIVLPALAGDVHAQWWQGQAAAFVEEGNEQLAEGETENALAAYAKAEMRSPGSAEVVFNKSVAFYRRGDYESAAAVAQDALATFDRELEVNATYNLARSLHEAAIVGEKNTESAMFKLSRAIGFYEDVLRLASNHQAAAANLSMAKRLMRFFEARLNDERDRPAPRKGTQPQEGESEQSPQRERQQHDSQSQKDETGQDAESQSANEKKTDGKPGKQDKASQQAAPQTQQPEDGQQDASAEPATIPIEEVEAMLQDARDAELRRRAVLRERAIREQERAKPEKDW